MNRYGRITPVERVEQESMSELLRESAQGDREAFTAFYELTSKRVYGLVRRIIVDAELAQDITQDIYVMVWLEARKYDPGAGSAMAWLMTIAHRRAVDRVRREQAGTNREVRWGIKNQDIEYDVVAETVTDRMEEQDVARCLRSLSRLQREAITLAYYDGLTYREVGARLSCPLPTVKSRIRDGLKQLRTCMGEPLAAEAF